MNVKSMLKISSEENMNSFNTVHLYGFFKERLSSEAVIEIKKRGKQKSIILKL